MFNHFLSHQWKEMTRSNFWQKSIVINIVIAFLLLIMFSYLVMLGIFIDKILEETHPGENPFQVFNGFILYYIFVDIFMRFFLYSLPVINAEAYLHLPVKKTKIINFILLKSTLNIFNVLPLLVFIPFAVKIVAPNHSVGTAFIWIILMLILVINNSYILHYLKRRFLDKPLIIAVFALIIGLTMLLDKMEIFSLSEYSSSLIGFLTLNPLYIIISMGVLIAIYALNYSYLKQRLTLEDVNIKKQKKIDSLSSIKLAESFGEIGEMILLELRMMWRNKRSRTIINMTPLFLLYGLFFYPNETYMEGFGFLIFVGIFITGGIMFNYGQYMLSYESNYFDAILSNNIDYQKHFKAKYYIMIAVIIISYLITIPYAFFGIKVFIINTAAFLFNLGFLTFLSMYFASNSRKRMDMSKGSAFNYQGVGATNWIMILPFFILPILIWLPFNILGVPYWGIATIGFIGLLSLAFHKSLLKLAVKRFEQKKHSIAAGFRE